MRRHLFDEDEHWTDEARELDAEVEKALRPIIERCDANGMAMREVEYICIGAVGSLCLSLIVRAASAQMKARKEDPR